LNIDELQVLNAIKMSQQRPMDLLLLNSAVRISLDWIAQEFPGNAVELRVPPFRVVQLLTGINHRRGTPPSVIEMSPQTWLKIVSKELAWESGVASGLIHASGEQSDLTKLLEGL
jgi:hypothetical protein